MPTDYNTTEEWKDIPEYEGYYQVSNHGRVRSLDRVIPRGRNRGSQTKRGIYLKSRITRDGYKKIAIAKFGLRREIFIHRLVLLVFAGQPPTTKYTCNHKNGVKDDNHINNLEWMTLSENVKHAYDSLGRYRNIGELNGGSKLTKDSVLEIRQLYLTGNYTQEMLRKLYCVSIITISRIIRRVSWKHIS